MDYLEDYNDLEKERLQLKIDWEGGLYEYCNYGIARRLYLKFKIYFDEAYLNNKWSCKKIKRLEPLVMNYLDERLEQKEYTDEELNSVNYIFDEKF